MTTATKPQWALTLVNVTREYTVENVPDLQDDSQKRRLIIRPRKVTLRIIPNTRKVHYACVEGQQVLLKADRWGNNLGGIRQVLAGLSSDRWSRATAPNWLNQLVTDGGFEWGTDGDWDTYRRAAK